jgi:hypothetical protein
MNYMKDNRFATYFGRKLSEKARSLNPVGTDYNRSQQQVNAVLGRKFNKGGGYSSNAANEVEAKGQVLTAAQRNRQNEQNAKKMSKPAMNMRADKNSIGRKLFGKGTGNV